MRVEGKKLAQVARAAARGLLQSATEHTQDHEQRDQSLAAFGLAFEEQDSADTPLASDKCYLWPCNALCWHIWQSLQTQWRVDSMGNRIGLDYGAVAEYLRTVVGINARRRRWRGTSWSEVWAGLQAMEGAALQAWAERR